MKIRKVRADGRRKSFEIATRSRSWWFPYAKADPPPTAGDPVDRVFVDPELGREAVTYVLRSGAEGSVHVDDVLDYNEDPAYMRDLLLHRLTVEAVKRIDKSGLSRREIARRLGTSPAQLYRLLDTANHRKTIDRMVALLRALDCSVDFVLRDDAPVPDSSRRA